MCSINLKRRSYLALMGHFHRGLGQHGYLISAVSVAGIGALSFVSRGSGFTQWLIPALQIFFALLGSLAAYVQGRQADRDSRISIDVRVEPTVMDRMPDFDDFI